MAKKSNEPRTYKCVVTGLDITYSGRGRPPKYHPSVKGDILKDQRKASRARKAAAKAAE